MRGEGYLGPVGGGSRRGTWIEELIGSVQSVGLLAVDLRKFQAKHSRVLLRHVSYLTRCSIRQCAEWWRLVGVRRGAV